MEFVDLIEFNELLDLLRDVSLSIVFLVLILVVFKKQKVNLEKYFINSTFRAILQLSALSFILAIIFAIENTFLIFSLLGFMTIFSAQTTAKRLENIPGIFKIQLIAQLITVYSIMGFVIIAGILPNQAAFIIPIGGMILSNAMNISYLIIDRILSDLKNRSNEIDTALALGASPDFVISNLRIIPDSIQNGLTPILNKYRNLGIVTIPGLMSGLIIGGISPVIAAVYQILIFLLVISAGLITGLISIYLSMDKIFDKTYYRLNYEIFSNSS
jgi:putative ABC transport system permease protein